MSLILLFDKSREVRFVQVVFLQSAFVPTSPILFHNKLRVERYVQAVFLLIALAPSSLIELDDKSREVVFPLRDAINFENLRKERRLMGFVKAVAAILLRYNSCFDI